MFFFLFSGEAILQIAEAQREIQARFEDSVCIDLFIAPMIHPIVLHF